MKKIVLLITGAAIMLSAFSIPVFSTERQYPRARADILIRDPFVLIHEGKYYMYGTGLVGDGYGCVVSEDLEHWSESIQVFKPEAGFDGVGNWWAPECHFYNGNYYLFATYYSAASGKRGTAVFRADSPLGPVALISNGHITPKAHDCIDGTLYVDAAGQPWIVYVSEWTSNADGVGEMCAAKLSRDLSSMISEPVTLFRGTDTRWATGKYTDGPFMYHTCTGRLLMLWSNSSKSGYAVGLAAPANNRVDGIWNQYPIPLYQKDKRHALDGGHGMIFTDLNGDLRMAIHAPNYAAEGVHETAEFLFLEDLGFTLAVKDDAGDNAQLRNCFLYAIKRIVHVYSSMVNQLRAAFSKVC